MESDVFLVPTEDPEILEIPVEDDGAFVEFGFIQSCAVDEIVKREEVRSASPPAYVEVRSTPSRAKIIALYLILLDSESTVYTFCNCDFLTNIRPHSSGRSVEVHSNGGTQFGKSIVPWY